MGWAKFESRVGWIVDKSSVQVIDGLAEESAYNGTVVRKSVNHRLKSIKLVALRLLDKLAPRRRRRREARTTIPSQPAVTIYDEDVERREVFIYATLLTTTSLVLLFEAPVCDLRRDLVWFDGLKLFWSMNLIARVEGTKKVFFHTFGKRNYEIWDHFKAKKLGVQSEGFFTSTGSFKRKAFKLLEVK